MARPLILVTGATGKTGSAVVRELIGRGQHVRALVHRRDARCAALAAQGAEVVVADMFNPDQLTDALSGVRRAYYLPLYSAHATQGALAFAQAARVAKLEQIVHMSQWLSHRAHPASMTRQIWLIDQMFADLPGIAHTRLNPGMFADNFLRVIDFAALLGVFPGLMGGGRAAPVSNEDIARCVATILMAPERHDRMSYRPTGPALLSHPDMAAIVTKVLGRRVLPVMLPWWLFLKVAAQQQVNPLEMSSVRHYRQEMMRGTFELDGGVTSVVEQLTGQPAESFETTARRYAALPFAQRTLRNRLKAVLSFAVTPVVPGYDLDRWERRVGLPQLAGPTLSIDDPRWCESHHHQMTCQAQPAARTADWPLATACA